METAGRGGVASRTPDFIGIGAQKAGTSWIYACLYDHPEIYIPIKEVHFFSRELNWARGHEWYEAHFRRCPPRGLAGEFSTSYLASAAAAERISALYPRVRLIACLRNPIERAYSNWLNDLQSGSESPYGSFRDAIARHPEYVRQGQYAALVRPYLVRFSPDQLLTVFYDDLVSDPQAFIRSIYRFLAVDPTHQPAALHNRVNEARVPRALGVDRLLNQAAGLLRRTGGDRLVWQVKQLGVARAIRQLNTRQRLNVAPVISPADRAFLVPRFEDSTCELERLLCRDLRAWRR